MSWFFALLYVIITFIVCIELSRQAQEEIDSQIVIHVWESGGKKKE